MTEDKRNVQDKYKWWLDLDIRADLEKTASGLSLVLLNLTGDFNVSSAIRVGNWFNVSSVYIVGKRHVDTRGAVGAHHYMTIEKRPEIEDVIAELKAKGKTIVAAEIADGAVALADYAWPSDVAIIFGEELRGVPEAVLSLCDAVVMVPGRGSVRSLNVATTAGIFSFDYSNKRGLL